MAFSLIANTSAGSSGGSSVTTSGIDTTGANLIVLETSNYHTIGTSITVSDSKGNTWSALNTYGPTNTESKLYYCLNPTVGSAHTFTITSNGGSTYPSIAVSAWSGAHASSSFDQQNGNNVAASSTLQVGSVTPTENDELIITGCAFYAGGTLSIDNGMTITNQTNYSAGNCMGVGLAYKIQTTAAAINPTWTHSVTFTDGAASIATFKVGVTPKSVIPNSSVPVAILAM